jgi:hypothetical protein
MKSFHFEHFMEAVFIFKDVNNINFFVTHMQYVIGAS